MTEYLTTKELAELLRIKERKVYDLAASGEIPCSRAMGKLLFPRSAIEAWIAQSGTGLAAAHSEPRPNIFLGSHDPLLDWALRESGCAIATYFDGSLDGLDRFVAGEGLASGLHIYEPETETWNTATVAARLSGAPVVLVEWAWRARGLIVAPEETGIEGIADLAGRRVAPRQGEAGSQKLFEHLLGEAGLGEDKLTLCAPARSEADAALAVLEGKADAALGLRALAASYRLGFVPIVKERFDLIVDRRAWFEAPMQTFLAFCRSDRFATRAEELAGYDVGGLGGVHYNGP